MILASYPLTRGGIYELLNFPQRLGDLDSHLLQTLRAVQNTIKYYSNCIIAVLLLGALRRPGQYYWHNSKMGVTLLQQYSFLEIIFVKSKS